MKKTLEQPPISEATLEVLNYLYYLPEFVIRDRYKDLQLIEKGNGRVILAALRRLARYTTDWRYALLTSPYAEKELEQSFEAAPYRPLAEKSLAFRAIAAILYQDLYPQFDRFQAKFNSFEELWCASEWDFMYRGMRGCGLIEATEEIKPLGKHKGLEQANKFFTYLNDPSLVRFNSNLLLRPVGESLFFYAIYHAQQNLQFRRNEFTQFTATLKRCDREIRNNKGFQMGYLLEDESLVLFEKHRKTVLKPSPNKSGKDANRIYSAPI